MLERLPPENRPSSARGAGSGAAARCLWVFGSPELSPRLPGGSCGGAGLYGRRRGDEPLRQCRLRAAAAAPPLIVSSRRLEFFGFSSVALVRDVPNLQPRGCFMAATRQTNTGAILRRRTRSRPHGTVWRCSDAASEVTGGTDRSGDLYRVDVIPRRPIGGRRSSGQCVRHRGNRDGRDRRRAARRDGDAREPAVDRAANHPRNRWRGRLPVHRSGHRDVHDHVRAARLLHGHTRRDPADGPVHSADRRGAGALDRPGDHHRERPEPRRRRDERGHRADPDAGG